MIKDINVFEMNNDISINVLSVENKDIYICRKGIRRDHDINLLLISEDDKLHYTVVKSLSRLLTSRNTKHKCKQYFCNNCLHWNRAETNTILTASISRPLEMRCLTKDRQ